MPFVARSSSRRRRPYSSAAHKTLNDAVRGLVDETHDVSDVCDVLAKTADLAGTADGVESEAVFAAKDTVKQVLRTRLCVPASDAICIGKHHIHGGNLKRLSEALANAKCCEELGDELDLPEFERLLHNLEVTADITSAEHETSAVELIEQLRCYVDGVAGELTETTAALICRELLGQMRRRPDACRELSRLGLIALLRRVLAGADRHEAGRALEEHPKLQLCAAHLLAEITLQRAMGPEHPGLGKMSTRQAWGEALTSEAQDETDLLPLDCRKAIDALYSGFHGALKVNQHSTVWAVASALQRLVNRMPVRERLCAVGFPLLIRRALGNYQRAPSDLPAPTRRLKSAVKTTSLQPPPFPRPPNLHALARGEKAKERWLRKSASSPQLRQGTSTVSSRKQRSDPTPETFPPVLWLAGQGSVEAGASYKVCDRAMLILQLKGVLRVLDRPS